MKLRTFAGPLLPLLFITSSALAKPCDRDRLAERLEKAYLNANFLGAVVKKVTAVPIEVTVPETLALNNGKNGYYHFVGKKIVRVYLKTQTLSEGFGYQVVRDDPVNEAFLFAHDFGTLEGECVAITNHTSWDSQDATGISPKFLRKWPFQTRSYSASCTWLTERFQNGNLSSSDPHLADFVGEIGKSNRLTLKILKMCSEIY